MVDGNEIKFNPAYELAFLRPEEQAMLHDILQAEMCIRDRLGNGHIQRVRFVVVDFDVILHHALQVQPLDARI